MNRRDLFKFPAAVSGGGVTRFHKAAAVLAALLLGLLGIRGTATAQAQSMESATSTPAASRGQGNGPVWLRIMAFTDAPVAGADVRVSVNGSQGRPLVDVHAATNKYGVFPVQVPSHPSSFRVEISGGTTNGDPFLGHLSADVVLTDPAHQIVVVNPVTTLVSLVVDKRPNLKLEGAQARVRTFLKLPVNYSLGMALRQGSHYASRFFSPVTFTTEVRDSGGLDAFEHLLLQELASDSATHSFRKPKLLGDTTSTATSDFEAGMEAGVLDYAGANNASNLTGWVMGLSGLSSGGSSSSIDALLDQLAELQSEIENLANQVGQLTNLVQSTANQTQYNTIVVPAQTLQETVNGVESDLTYFAQACPPLPAGSTPKTPSVYCTSEKVSVNTELNDVTIQQAYVTMEGYVGDNGTTGFRGMLHLYSLWLAESKPFWRAADSTKMQDLYNYWDASLAQAANLKLELLHENDAQDGDPKQLTDLMGNPNLSPPTKGTFQANQAANLNLMGSPVPEGTVVSTVNLTMWSLNPWQPVPNQTPPAGKFAVVQPAEPSEPVCWAVTASNSLNIAASSSTYYGKTGWGNSTYDDWTAAVKLAPSGTDWQTWLTQQTQVLPQEANDTGAEESDGFATELMWQLCYPLHSIWAPEYISGKDPGSVSSYTWWAVFPNGQSSIVTEETSDTNFIWPTRYTTFIGGVGNEFYFWTN